MADARARHPRTRRPAVHRRAADRVAPPVLVERASSPRSSPASRSSTRSPTRRRSTPTTGSSSSTPAASSTPSACTRRCGAGRRAASTPRSSRTATSTTSSASTSTRRRRARTAGRRRASSRTRRVAARFDRYRLTAGYNAVINQRQFQAPRTALADRVPLSRRDLPRPPHARRRRRALRAAPRPRRDRRRDVGLVARRRKVLFAGDLFIWASPNCGNPQKVQRYARDWARGVPQDGRARRPRCCCPATACRSSAPTACGRRSPKAPSCSSRSSSRRSR